MIYLNITNLRAKRAVERKLGLLWKHRLFIGLLCVFSPDRDEMLDGTPELVIIQKKKFKYQNVKGKIKEIIPAWRDSTILIRQMCGGLIFYLYVLIFALLSGCGGTGRRAGFRCLWAYTRVGSTPIIRILQAPS